MSGSSDPLHRRTLSITSAFLGIAMLTGCATPRTSSEEELVSQASRAIKYCTLSPEALRQVLVTDAELQAVSIDTDPEWDGITILVRSLKQGTISCDKYRTKCYGGRDEVPAPRRLYAIRNVQAVEMFRLLCEQVSEGHKFRSKGWNWRRTSNPQGSYSFVVGMPGDITIEENLTDWGTAVAQVSNWNVALLFDEPVREADLAESIFDADLISMAAYVEYALWVFDTLCIVAHGEPDDVGVPSSTNAGEVLGLP